MDDLAPPVLISAQQHFGVGIAREAVTEPSELLSQLAKVVDFPIEGQREAGLGIAHRLARAFRVDDGKPPVPQEHVVAGAGAAEACSTLIVGPAMGDRMQHRLERVFRERTLRSRDPSRNSAHIGLRLRSRALRSSRALQHQYSKNSSAAVEWTRTELARPCGTRYSRHTRRLSLRNGVGSSTDLTSMMQPRRTTFSI